MNETIRLKVTLAFLGLISLAFAIRLFKIQILEFKEYRELAKQNYIKALKIPHLRGRILDRNGHVIAEWTPSFRISVIAEKVEKEEILELSRFLDIPVDLSRLSTGPGYIPIFDDVPMEKILKLQEVADRFPWAVVSPYPKRNYISDSVLARAISHVVGYVGEASENDIATGRYSLGDYLGKYGVEKQYESILRGRDGYRFFAVDVHGRIIKADPRPMIPPEKGHDLILSIDLDLERFIDSLFEPYEAGACVVLNAKNGEVLALYSKPGFDPNKMSFGLTFSEWLELINSPQKPLLNRAICGRYPPGSIYKLVSAVIGLEVGVLDSSKRFLPCYGSFRFGRRVWRCWRPEGHGSLDLPHAIEQSCDVYFYQVGIAIGLERFLDYSQKLPLAIKTGIDLPGECTGFIPTISWYEKTYGKRGFGPGNVLNLAIGQGEILLTPLEMATFTALIARGKVPRPHVVHEIEGLGPPKVDTLVLPVDTTKLGPVRYGMWLVVNGLHGTARWSRPLTVEAAGKTGTAQNPHGEDHALFTVYAPYSDPEIVVTVVVENAGHGGAVAAPIANRVVDYYFEKLRASLAAATDITH